jgi:hypothetical protein
MFKKILSYFFIVFGLVVLWASTSRTAMQYITQHRDNEKWWGAYPCLHGDLVSLSYLDFVQRFYSPRDNTPARTVTCNGQKNTVLYLHGDSYSRRLGDSNFACVQTYIPIDRNHGANYHLDSSKKNILLIEISERYFRPYFSSLQMLDEVCDSVIKKKNIALKYLRVQPDTRCASVIPGFHVNDLFNKFINQNLQCNLFNYNFIMPMFESKAALNYYLFNRASGDVVISGDRNFLFLKETVTRTDVGSSYYPVSQNDITNMVNNLNTIYDHYKQNGFKEVYLSVIPNSATIMQPAEYNGLIPQLQSDTRLKIKVIDVYSAFKRSQDVLYLPGDTHWNHKGRQIWLDMINEQLSK